MSEIFYLIKIFTVKMLSSNKVYIICANKLIYTCTNGQDLLIHEKKPVDLVLSTFDDGPSCRLHGQTRR